MQSEGGWARIAWAGGKLSTKETVCHVGRVKKQFKGGPGGAASEPGLNDFVAMAVGADGLGAAARPLKVF